MLGSRIVLVKHALGQTFEKRKDRLMYIYIYIAMYVYTNISYM